MLHIFRSVNVFASEKHRVVSLLGCPLQPGIISHRYVGNRSKERKKKTLLDSAADLEGGSISATPPPPSRVGVVVIFSQFQTFYCVMLAIFHYLFIF